MTGEQFGGVVRAVATAVLGFLAGKGYIGGDQAAVIATAIGTIAVAAWSIRTNKPTS